MVEERERKREREGEREHNFTHVQILMNVQRALMITAVQ